MKYFLIGAALVAVGAAAYIAIAIFALAKM
jgi:hypothetical protein